MTRFWGNHHQLPSKSSDPKDKYIEQIWELSNQRYIYIYIFIQNFPFTTGAPASAYNIYDTNIYVIYTNILSKNIHMTCNIKDI